MDNSSALENAKKYAFLVKSQYKTSRVFLFGSQAKGTSNVDSDIDIAVVLDDYANKLDMMLELMRLRRRIDTRIEPHPFRKSDFNESNILVKEIIQHGFELIN